MAFSSMRPDAAANWRATQCATLAAWSILAAVSAALFLEAPFYATRLAGGAEGASGWDRVLLVWMLASKTLLVLAIALAPAAVAALAGRRRAAHWLAAVSAALAVWWVIVDVKTYAVTGNHVVRYLQFAQSGAGDNAGGYAWMFLLALRTLGPAAVFVAGSLWLVRLGAGRLLARRRRGLGAAVVVVLGMAWLAVAFGWAAVQGRFSSPTALRALATTLPVDMSFLVRPDPVLRRFARQFDRAIAPSLERWAEAIRRGLGADERTRLSEGDLPDILLIVCESLRFDAVEPDTMPGVDAWARTGRRFARHYSGGNATTPGLFELLYGRSCMTMDATLDAQTPPQLCTTLRLSGYERTFLSCVSVNWQRIDQFINERTFDRVEIDPTGDWAAGDRRVIERARQILLGPTDRPRFVMAFLQSTHLPYLYPPESERFTPVVGAGAIVLDFTPADEARLKNRYRNAAGYLDRLIAGLVADLDPARTLMVVTGDHGESFFDDGAAFHSSRLSDVQCRTPLVMVGANVPPGVEERLTVHADMLPTLLHAAAGSPVRPAGVHGIDLLAPPGSVAREYIILAGSYGDPASLALVGPPGRLGLRLSFKGRRAEVMGRLGPDGLPSESPLDPAEAPAWAEAVSQQFRRMVE